MSKLRVVLSGGGTGGHRLPVLAVLERLRAAGEVKAYYFGTETDIASPEIKASGLSTVAITSGKLRRYLSWRNLSDLYLVWRGYTLAKKALAEIKPYVVFVKGGYVSIPVALAARRLGIPVITHESDAHLGLANRIIGRRADRVATSFPTTVFPRSWQGRLVETGPIIRRSLLGAKPLAVSKKRPVVLVLGGSQGAARVNRLVWAALPWLVNRATVIHQTGTKDAPEARAVKERLGGGRNYQPTPYFESLDRELARADLVISRSGSTVFELALFGLPTILIPLSTSAGDHQMKNARYFEKMGAAVVLDERHLTDRQFQAVVRRLLRSSARRQALGRAIAALARTKGAEKVAELIMAYARS